YSAQFGLPGDIPVPMDITGDGRAELRVWRPANGTWYSFERFSSQTSTQQYGLPGDMPAEAPLAARRWVATDNDGDSRADIGVYRPSTGEWFMKSSASGYATFSQVQWGIPGDVPVGGDYDGTRHLQPAVYRPATGEWYVRHADGSVLWRQWGTPGDVP